MTQVESELLDIIIYIIYVYKPDNAQEHTFYHCACIYAAQCSHSAVNKEKIYGTLLDSWRK